MSQAIKFDRRHISEALLNYLIIHRYTLFVTTPSTRIPEGSWVKLGNELARFEGSAPDNPSKWLVTYMISNETDLLSKGAFTTMDMVHPECAPLVNRAIEGFCEDAREDQEAFVANWIGR